MNDCTNEASVILQRGKERREKCIASTVTGRGRAQTSFFMFPISRIGLLGGILGKKESQPAPQPAPTQPQVCATCQNQQQVNVVHHHVHSGPCGQKPCPRRKRRRCRQCRQVGSWRSQREVGQNNHQQGWRAPRMPVSGRKRYSSSL